MIERVYNVLFLSTGNSARSILAEALLNQAGKGRFKAFSAGSHPTGEVNPFVLELLERQHFPTADLRSKSWLEFATPNAPALDFVFIVCDDAAGEDRPMWPNQLMTAHWAIEAPGVVEGDDEVKRMQVTKVLHMLIRRIGIFVNLPLDSLDDLTLQRHLNDIGIADT